jgi:hypothetical protein
MQATGNRAPARARTNAECCLFRFGTCPDSSMTVNTNAGAPRDAPGSHRAITGSLSPSHRHSNRSDALAGTSARRQLYCRRRVSERHPNVCRVDMVFLERAHQVGVRRPTDVGHPRVSTSGVQVSRPRRRNGNGPGGAILSFQTRQMKSLIGTNKAYSAPGEVLGSSPARSLAQSIRTRPS